MIALKDLDLPALTVVVECYDRSCTSSALTCLPLPERPLPVCKRHLEEIIRSLLLDWYPSAAEAEVGS